MTAPHKVAPHKVAPQKKYGFSTLEEAKKKREELKSEIAEKTEKRNELMDKLGLQHRVYFLKYYLQPALKWGLIEMTIPEKTNSMHQRYRKKSTDNTKPMDNQP